MERKGMWRREWVQWVSGLAVVAAATGVGYAADPSEAGPEQTAGAPVPIAVAAVPDPASGFAPHSGIGLQPASCAPFGVVGSTAPEPAAVIPRPWPGDNCPTNRCSVDFDCANECMVPNCPPPCGACVYETSEACSGYCFCR